jgi:zinc transporter ZupT
VGDGISRICYPARGGFTVELPVPSDQVLGFLIGIAGGVLIYIGAAHLLPEAQVEHPSRIVVVLFTATLLITTIALMDVLGG